ncbi:MAG: hypothetical protein ACYDCB_05280, partial [Candidatus Dormibacteria bacterium]
MTRNGEAQDDSDALHNAALEAISRLEAGERLPEEFKYSLFDRKHEYELTYSGKKTRSDILSATMAVP